VIPAAYELNAPVAADNATSGESAAVAGNGSGAAIRSFCSVDGRQVIIETVKAAEPPPEDVEAGSPAASAKRLILRLYESLGGHAETSLRFSRELAGAWATDMLEENGRPMPFTGRELALSFRPFEIKTLAVEFRG